MITLVPFYKKIHNVPNKKLKHRLSFFDYEDCLKKMKETFFYHHGQENKFIVQTDYETTLKKFDTFRSNLTDLSLIESISLSNKNFIEVNQGNLVLVGADHIVCGNLNTVYEHDFDIATFIARNDFDPMHRTNIINFLFIRCDNNNHAKINKFMQHRHQIFQSLAVDERTWWGDQKSLSLLLEEKKIISNYFNDSISTQMFDGLKIKLFKYGEEYIRFPHDNLTILPNTVMIDFAGGHSVKQHFDHFYKLSLAK